MKILIATGFFASAANGALSTLRVGPRKAIRADAGFEFGRPVDVVDHDVVDVDAAFQEMKLIQRRFLQGGASYILGPGASFPLPGMSLQYPGMSLEYPGMSLEYPGMSLQSPGMSLSHSSSHPPTITLSPKTAPPGLTADLPTSSDVTGNCVGRDLTASTQIHIQLDVDSSVTGTLFLADLARNIVSFGEGRFSLCQESGNGRLLLEPVLSQDQYNVTVTGLEARAYVGSGNTPEVCIPGEHGAYCTIVDVVLMVYSASEESSADAEQQVYDEVLVKQVEAGTFVNGDIIAIRFHPKQDYPTDSSAVSKGGIHQASTGGAQDSSTVRTIVISVLVLVAVAVLVGLVYRKRMGNQRVISDAGSEDDSECDRSSSITGDSEVSGSLGQPTEDSQRSI